MKINKLLSLSIYMLSIIFISNMFISNIYSWVKVRNNTGTDILAWIDVTKGGDNIILMKVPANKSMETNDDQAGAPMIKKEVKIYAPTQRKVKRSFYNTGSFDKSKWEEVEQKVWGIAVKGKKIVQEEVKLKDNYEFIPADPDTPLDSTNPNDWGYLLKKGTDGKYLSDWVPTDYYGTECDNKDLNDDGTCKKTQDIDKRSELTRVSYKNPVKVTEPNIIKSCGAFSCGSFSVVYILSVKANTRGKSKGKIEKPQFDYVLDHTTVFKWNHEKGVINLNED